MFRFQVFVENMIKIYLHNKQYKNENTTFELAMNQYTDLFHYEFLLLHKLDLG